MSRRTKGLPRRAREWWPTPVAAVAPLIPHLPRAPSSYIEPCAGDGALVHALAELWPQGTCSLACDVHPLATWIEERDLFEVQERADLRITNPPWPRVASKGEPVVGMVRHLAAQGPTWLLLDAGFALAQYFAQVSGICRAIVPVGRVSWMGNGKNGYSDSAWLLFDATDPGPTIFHPYVRP